MRANYISFLSVFLLACSPDTVPESEVKVRIEPAERLNTFWEVKPRKGTNSFLNTPPTQAYFDAFAAYGGEWVRLSWTKWDSASQGTFLIGDPSNYNGLVPEDLDILKEVVRRADNSGLKVVLTPLSLPGSVWKQHNNDEIDDRIYSDKTYWSQSAEFWVDLAVVFKNDPAIAAYNLLNEPSPERPSGFESGTYEENKTWYESQKGSARDLPDFYNFVISAIREIDPHTTIMVDGGFFGNPEGFSYFISGLEDENILYDFHMYKPWAATSTWNVRNGSKLKYPGDMEIWGTSQLWNAKRIAETIQQPLDWAEKEGIRRSQMVMGEFGCHRYLNWCPIYLEDVLQVADKTEIHWAFYTFRSDSWGGMDYELGNQRPGTKSFGVTTEQFWKLSSENRLGELSRSNTTVFEPISRRLKENLNLKSE